MALFSLTPHRNGARGIGLGEFAWRQSKRNRKNRIRLTRKCSNDRLAQQLAALHLRTVSCSFFFTGRKKDPSTKREAGKKIAQTKIEKEKQAESKGWYWTHGAHGRPHASSNPAQGFGIGKIRLLK